MNNKYRFEHLNFNNQDLIILQRILDENSQEILLCMTPQRKHIYLFNNQIIEEQLTIDILDEKYWRSPKLRGIVE